MEKMAKTFLVFINFKSAMDNGDCVCDGIIHCKLTSLSWYYNYESKIEMTDKPVYVK